MGAVTPNRNPHVREIVSTLAKSQPWFAVPHVAALTGTSRQAVHRQLAGLVRAGVLEVHGKGRATRYRLTTSPTSAPASEIPAAFARNYPTRGLQEDRVWQDVLAALTPPLGEPGRKNAQALLSYALTEMVNNAIDHAGAPAVAVQASIARTAAPGDTHDIWFEVTDLGVGAFENVRAALNLPDHLTALQEISKGKRSTQPDRHSGEGLFFTSKMADLFELHANGLVWNVDNRRRDEAIGASATSPGTRVRFAIAADKSEPPEAVFARYTHGFEFDTTRTVVKLFEYGVRFVSRSEAKRLLEGLERFSHVIVDFAGVESVGQGFADEVFRVWARNHAAISLTAQNMTPPVAFMVKRVQGQTA